jgi:hypothetical protein
MYHFSRSIYRELAPSIRARDIQGRDCGEADAAAHHQVLMACEETIKRLASDRRYFAKPTKTLFTDIRDHFALNHQVRVYMIIERHMELIVEYIESLPDELTLDGQPRQCPASTRKGTPCQREPRPGLEYCPSHRHLEEVVEIPEELVAAA